MVKQKNEIKKSNWLTNNTYSLIFISLICFVLYGNTIGHGYNMDDVFVVKDNPMVQKGIKAIPEIFTSRYFENNQSKFGYRPFTKAVYAVEVSVFGSNVHVSHFINILLYALLSFLVLIWLKRLFINQTGILFIWAVLLLWLFHPIHTEVVASLKNREEILYLLFAVWSSILFLDYIEKGSFFYLFFALILFISSYLSKQSAISFALVLPIVFYFKYLAHYNRKELMTAAILKNKLFLRIIISLVTLWIATYIMYKLPNWLFPPDDLELYSFENPLRYNHAWSAHFSIASLTMIYYLRLLLFPHPLLFYYGLYTLPEVSMSDAIVWISVVVHILILVFCILKWKKNKYLLFGYLFYLAAIFPFSNYMIEINGIVADRFLWTFLGFCHFYGFGHFLFLQNTTKRGKIEIDT